VHDSCDLSLTGAGFALKQNGWDVRVPRRIEGGQPLDLGTQGAYRRGIAQ
jgi:hypothetical protein